MAEKKTIRENLDELEKITDRLADPDLGLEEALKLYTRGVKLADASRKSLGEIQKKVKQIEEDGTISETDPLESEDSGSDEE